jgi:hypothetical protein
MPAANESTGFSQSPHPFGDADTLPLCNYGALHLHLLLISPQPDPLGEPFENFSIGQQKRLLQTTYNLNTVNAVLKGKKVGTKRIRDMVSQGCLAVCAGTGERDTFRVYFLQVPCQPVCVNFVTSKT